MAGKDFQKQLSKKLREIFESEDGQRAFSESSQCAKNKVEELKKARFVDPERLKRPITV